MAGGRERGLHHVVDECEVTHLPPVPVHGHGTAGQHAPEEGGERHVRALPGPVGREVAQPDHRHAEAAHVHTRQLLGRHLGHAVRRDGTPLGVLGGGVARGVAVDRRRRRVHECVRSGAGGLLEQALSGHHVVAHVTREALAEAAAHARLRSEVEHPVDALEQPLERVPRQVELE